MARLLAALRLLHTLALRDLRSLSSVAFSNLVFCVLLLAQGTTGKAAFFSTILLQAVLLLPLLVSDAAEANGRPPLDRVRLWPLSAKERAVLWIAKLLYSPLVWLLVLLYTAWIGPAGGAGLLALAVGVHALTGFAMAAATRLNGRSPRLRLPPPPGKLGGLARVSLWHMVRSLDVSAATLLCVAGSLYRFGSERFGARAAEPEALPVIGMMVALALSTYAQRLFGMESPGALQRYRLLPVSPWRILLVKDLVYLTLASLLVLPLSWMAGVAFSLVALAVGRYPSLRQRAPQSPWRFTGGDLRFGLMQVVGGSLAGFAAVRLTRWSLLVPALLWAVSLWQGQRWWRMRAE